MLWSLHLCVLCLLLYPVATLQFRGFGRCWPNGMRAIATLGLKSDRPQTRSTVLFMSDGMKSGIASGISSALVKIALQPLDTIKTVQQAERHTLTPFQACSAVVKSRGILGLWSGMGITVLGSSLSSAVYFGLYSAIKKHLKPRLSPVLTIALSAAIANTVASVLRSPYEVSVFVFLSILYLNVV